MVAQMNNIVYEHGINDMPRGWTRKNKLNKSIYSKWNTMLQRIYSEKFTDKDKNKCYIDCTVCLEWHWLSKFVEDFKNIDGYNEEKLLNGELELDKDIKSNGKNKEYSLENCTLVSKHDNIKQANKTKDYNYMKKENNWNYGGISDETKQKISSSKKGKYCGEDSWNYGLVRSNETKKKISESKKGQNKGEKHPNAKKIAQYDKNDNLIKIWECMKYACEELGISATCISECCTGKQKTAGGFKWKYYKEEEK